MSKRGVRTYYIRESKKSDCERRVKEGRRIMGKAGVDEVESSKREEWRGSLEGYHHHHRRRRMCHPSSLHLFERSNGFFSNPKKEKEIPFKQNQGIDDQGHSCYPRNQS
jgi:hypothetical protein